MKETTKIIFQKTEFENEPIIIDIIENGEACQVMLFSDHLAEAIKMYLKGHDMVLGKSKHFAG